MSRGATARLFVAVDPPWHVREQLAEWARGVAGGSSSPAGGSSRRALRLLGAQSLHLTLCFLGSRPVAEIDALASALGSCASHACELSVGAPLWLPASRPRALAVEIRDRAGELARGRQEVIRALSEVSCWEPRRRRFWAHVTVARIRAGAASARWVTLDGSDGAQPLPVTPRLRFMPESITLYRSWLAPEGARYEAIARAGGEPSAQE